MTAVAEMGWALRDADASLKADKDVVVAAVTETGWALRYADASLKADKDVVVAAVRQMGWALLYADTSLKADKDVVMAAVRKDGRALLYTDASLKADKDVVMAAVMQDGRALEFADASLKADKDVVMAAVKQSSRALEFADHPLVDLEVRLVAARHGPATEALKLVRQLRKLPDWQEREATIDCAVEMLASFPVSAAFPKVHEQLHNAVERMIKKAYQPGRKRDREAFEKEVFAP